MKQLLWDNYSYNNFYPKIDVTLGNKFHTLNVTTIMGQLFL